MRQVVEAYAGLWIILTLFWVAIAFTSINLNVSQARKIVSDIKAEVQASNGSVVDDSNELKFESATDSMKDHGYEFECIITRLKTTADAKDMIGNTFIYNDIYKIDFTYTYFVPFFGQQVYPLHTFAF